MGNLIWLDCYGNWPKRSSLYNWTEFSFGIFFWHIFRSYLSQNRPPCRDDLSIEIYNKICERDRMVINSDVGFACEVMLRLHASATLALLETGVDLTNCLLPLTWIVMIPNEGNCEFLLSVDLCRLNLGLSLFSNVNV